MWWQGWTSLIHNWLSIMLCVRRQGTISWIFSFQGIIHCSIMLPPSWNWASQIVNTWGGGLWSWELSLFPFSLLVSHLLPVGPRKFNLMHLALGPSSSRDYSSSSQKTFWFDPIKFSLPKSYPAPSLITRSLTSSQAQLFVVLADVPERAPGRALGSVWNTEFVSTATVPRVDRFCVRAHSASFHINSLMSTVLCPDSAKDTSLQLLLRDNVSQIQTKINSVKTCHREVWRWVIDREGERGGGGNRSKTDRQTERGGAKRLQFCK